MQRQFFLTISLLIAASAAIGVWFAKPGRSQRHKQRLIAAMRNKHSGPAGQAVARLRSLGWLYDGSLRDAILTGSNLAGVDLAGADLSAAWLGYSSFQDCRLAGANMEAADLRLSNLERADLRGAYLSKANLRDATFDGETLLPDGSRWTRATDTGRFTDPRHPQFWRPARPYSAPAG